MVFSSVINQCCKGMWLMGFFNKSQAAREENNNSVKIAVTKNFNDIVLDSGREAFILFYAPWCKYCNQIAPVWDELGYQLKDEEVDIVKIDATSNQWPKNDYYVYSYPTIYWKFADKSKKPIRYNGGRTLQDFLKYVSEKSTTELSGWNRQGRRKWN